MSLSIICSGEGGETSSLRREGGEKGKNLASISGRK